MHSKVGYIHCRGRGNEDSLRRSACCICGESAWREQKYTKHIQDMVQERTHVNNILPSFKIEYTSTYTTHKNQYTINKYTNNHGSRRTPPSITLGIHPTILTNDTSITMCLPLLPLPCLRTSIDSQSKR